LSKVVKINRRERSSNCVSIKLSQLQI
jgi:hypothetical protein